VIRRVLDIYVEQAPVLMPASAAVFVLTGILTGALVAAGPGPALIALIISLLATTLFTGVVVQLVADVRDGRRDASVGQLLRAVGPVMGQLILVGIAAAVGIAVGFVLFVIPGLVLITLWSVAAAVVVLERPPGLQALSRSRELVRGNGLRVFAVILLLDIAVVILATALELLANSAGTGVGIVVRVVVGVLAAPLSALAAAVLYFQLREISAAGPADAAGGA
jgi:hypothetical protein